MVALSRYKTRLVANGYLKQESNDFDETCPIVKKPTVRIILSLVAQFDWKLRQLDVKKCILTR